MGAIAIIAATLIALVVVGDVILAIKSSGEKYENVGITWSQLLRESYGITISITWVISIWIGRWFSPLTESLLKFRYSLIVSLIGVLTITLIVELLGILLSRRYRRPVIPPIVVVLLGLVCGAVLIPLTPTL